MKKLFTLLALLTCIPGKSPIIFSTKNLDSLIEKNDNFNTLYNNFMKLETNFINLIGGQVGEFFNTGVLHFVRPMDEKPEAYLFKNFYKQYNKNKVMIRAVDFYQKIEEAAKDMVNKINEKIDDTKKEGDLKKIFTILKNIVETIHNIENDPEYKKFKKEIDKKGDFEHFKISFALIQSFKKDFENSFLKLGAIK